VGLLGKDDQVETRRTYGEWLQIAPPPGCALWIHRDWAKPLADASSAASAPAGAQPSVSTPPPALATKGLKPDAAQGQLSVWEGVLQPIDFFFNKPGDYRLSRPGGDGADKTVCYLQGNAVQLEALVGRKLRIAGREYWLKRTTIPVVVPETITPLP
jgi:hypothetical protein